MLLSLFLATTNQNLHMLVMHLLFFTVTCLAGCLAAAQGSVFMASAVIYGTPMKRRILRVIRFVWDV